jgi:hypothetical protein
MISMKTSGVDISGQLCFTRSAKKRGAQNPFMITFDFGNGRVFRSEPHLEIEEDQTNLGYYDPESDWPMPVEVIDELR